MSGVGAVVKVVDSHHCGRGSISGKSCSFLSLLKQRAYHCASCSAQHVKYRMPRGFPLTSSVLLDYHVKQYIHIAWPMCCRRLAVDWVPWCLVK